MFSTVPHRRISHLFARSIVAAASALFVAGCTAAPVLTPIATSPSPTPTESEPTVEVVDEPVPFLDVACADLITEETLYDVFGVAISLQRPQFRELDADYGPIGYSLRQAGGIECEWGNGQPMTFSRGGDPHSSNPEFAGVVVRVLPQALDQWAVYTDYYGDLQSNSYPLYCSFGEPGRSFCQIDQLINEAWMEVLILEPRRLENESDDEVLARADAIVMEVKEGLSTAPAADSIWIAPPDTIDLGVECADLIAPDEVARLLGVDEPVVTNFGGGGWSLSASSRVVAGGEFCSWGREKDPMSFPTGLSMTWLPASEWAWDDSPESASYSPVTIDGLIGDDRAFLRSARGDDLPTLALIVGGTWIQLTVYPRADGRGTVEPDGAALLSIGQVVVATIRS